MNIGNRLALVCALIAIGSVNAQVPWTANPAAGVPPIGGVPLVSENWECGDVYYVSPSGNDSNPGTLASPWRSISFAVSQALSLSAPGTPMTINVMAGLHSTFTGNTFPIRLPARGIKLQGYEPGARIAGTTFAPVILVNRRGRLTGPCGRTPDTLIMGLELREGQAGVSIDTSLVGTAASTPDRVRVRRCLITENTAVGVTIRTDLGRRSLHVIEENEISFNANSLGFGTGIAAFDFHSGGAVESSYKIRANNIHDNEIGIEIRNFGDPSRCRPRIASNFIRDAEWGIFLATCSSHLVNNTQGFGRAFSAGFPVYGMLLGGDGLHEIVNNIVWNPVSYAPTASSVTDIESSSLTTTPITATNWVLSVVGAGNSPDFVSPPPSATPDLHLLPTSPLIDAGTNSFVLPTITLNTGTMSVRADIGIDADGDSRVIDYTRDASADVEIGADELIGTPAFPVRMSTISGADSLGNVITGGAVTPLTFEITARPADRCAVYSWINITSDPLSRNSFQSALGNLLVFQSGPQGGLVGGGMANASGIFQQTFNVDPAVLGFEKHMYFQGVAVYISGGVTFGDFTNRMRIEVNE